MAAPVSVEEAWRRIAQSVTPAPVCRVPLAQAVGCVLAEDAHADREWPPFDRSMVDGFAVRAADTSPGAELAVITEITAGQSSDRAVAAGQAAEINTGAPVPPGADAVIMVEQTVRAGSRIQLKSAVRPGQNISPHGEDARAGAIVVPAGTSLNAAEIGVLAFVGCHNVPVRPRPRVAVLATGNELVEPHETPKAAQIRNSNSVQLLAQCAQWGIDARYLGVARDDRDATRRLLEEGMANSDFLITTGGVSVGAHDHVGPALRELGVDVHFDKVAVKPGKPTTFGQRGRQWVFGLPGNPVAALVCFHLFVRTAFRAWMAAQPLRPRSITARCGGKVLSAGDRETFRPGRWAVDNNEAVVAPVEWHGSGHLAALVGVDGLLRQPAGVALQPGQSIEFFPFSW